MRCRSRCASAWRPRAWSSRARRPDERLVEIIELTDHPFFVASQFHPEFKSRPERPAPLFREFVAAALERARERAPEGGEVRARARPSGRRVRRQSSDAARLGGRAPPAERARSPSSARIASPFGHERRGRRPRRRASCGALGLEVEEDEAGTEIGGDARQPPRAPARPQRALASCSAPTSTPSRTTARSSRCWSTAAGRARARRSSAPTTRRPCRCCWRSRTARRSRAAPVGVELLFTVGEENGLQGAKAFDVAKLRSEVGYVFDHASPIGEIIVASPTFYRLQARFRGQAAHAGHPARGRPQRDPRRGEGDRRDAPRPPRPRDDGERRQHPRRRGRDEHRPRALHAARRGARRWTRPRPTS